MSFVRVIETLHKQLQSDPDVIKYLDARGVVIGEHSGGVPENTKYVTYIMPNFERESDEGLTLDSPNDPLDENRQTNEVKYVILIKAKVLDNDLPNRITGLPGKPGVLEMCRILKKAITKRWTLGINGIEGFRIENTQHVERGRHAEVQITMVWTEIVYEKTRETAPSFDNPEEVP